MPNRRIPSRRRRAGLLLPALLTAACLGACESSYDEYADWFNARRTPPPTATPPTTNFGPNFSEIQASVFTPSCATAGCHVGVAPAASLNLDAASSYAMLVGVASSQDPATPRVTPGNPANSYLVQKLEGSAATGQQMPPAGALQQADIDTIKQWITAGAVDDRAQPATPVRVTSLSVVPGSTLSAAPNEITAGFDRELDASTVNANTFLLERSNNDATFDDGDDVAITAASITVPAANPRSAVFSLSGVNLPDDTYRVRLLGTGASIIMDLDANALDGEFSGAFPSGNGSAGGNFAVQFMLATPVAIGPTLDEIQAAVFTPSCATAGCHNNGSQAAGLSLADADTSYLEMVGQFSNQNGQANVMLVAPNDPDNSYLIRKLENAPGITGSRMPLGRPALPQSDIDQIRQWISDGALR